MLDDDTARRQDAHDCALLRIFHHREYTWRRRNDGVHILNINRTYEKINLAARIIVAVENPADVMAVSARPYGQRAVLKFAQYTGAKALAGRYTPGHVVVMDSFFY